jgi:uncharacterized membrane protein YhaH (DUF805 family)
MNPNMTPVDWAKRPLQKYADFGGRAPRAEYWWYVLAVIIVTIVASIIEGVLGLDAMFATYGPLTLLLMLALIVPGIAVAVRRLHDTDRSGWWVLLPLIPYAMAMVLAGPAMASGSMTGLGTAGIFSILGMIGGIVLLVFMILPGTAGDNRYGPDPYGGTEPAPAG